MSKYTTLPIIKEAVAQAQRDISSLGFNELDNRKFFVVLSPKYTDWAGQAQRKGNNCFLKFNIPYMEMTTDKDALETIYHEVAHCINNGGGHRGRWKTCAILIRKNFDIPVSTTFSFPAYEEAQRQHRLQSHAGKPVWFAVCLDCGFAHHPYYSPNGKAVTSIRKGEHKYSCAKCRSKNLEIQTKINNII